jgi:hypothetical protein
LTQGGGEKQDGNDLKPQNTDKMTHGNIGTLPQQKGKGVNRSRYFSSSVVSGIKTPEKESGILSTEDVIIFSVRSESYE